MRFWEEFYLVNKTTSFTYKYAFQMLDTSNYPYTEDATQKYKEYVTLHKVDGCQVQIAQF